MKQTLEEAKREYVEKHVSRNEYASFGEAFEAGAEFQAKQNPWRNFKDECPEPNSHILRRMTNPDYQAYRKKIYYADFWGEDRPDKWKQDNDRVVYEWKYINE